MYENLWAEWLKGRTPVLTTHSVAIFEAESVPPRPDARNHPYTLVHSHGTVNYELHLFVPIKVTCNASTAFIDNHRVSLDGKFGKSYVAIPLDYLKRVYQPDKIDKTVEFSKALDELADIHSCSVVDVLKRVSSDQRTPYHVVAEYLGLKVEAVVLRLQTSETLDDLFMDDPDDEDDFNN